MKARRVPVFFAEGRDEVFDVQLDRLKTMLSDDAEWWPDAYRGRLQNLMLFRPRSMVDKKVE